MSQHLQPGTDITTSTLRPRTARLISYLDEGDESPGELTPTAVAKRTSSAELGRSSSSLPLVGRAKSVTDKQGKTKAKGFHVRSTSEHGATEPANTIWEPWSSIQEIASTLLGSDLSAVEKGKAKTKTASPSRRKTQTLKGTSGAQWGPLPGTATQSVDPSIEERWSMLQAKKREAILVANANAGRDALGRYKRRDSISDVYNKDPDQDEDALVYLHKVQSGDTMAGVTIKYGCQLEVFRKVNRFWPNDSIQTRHSVLLPVDLCAVRCRKLGELDLLSSDLESVPINDSMGEPSQTSDKILYTSEAILSPESTFSSSSLIENARHESWVLIPGFPKPVEMLRLPRRTLGYFPPARRKSITSPPDGSTPKTSLDLLRHPPTHAASLNASPVRHAKMAYDITRHRSSSSSAPAPSFADHLKGPGGVGSLRGLRTEPSRPGPGPDPLNQNFGQYLPDLAPPEAFPRTSLRPSPRATPRASTDSIRSASSAGLSDVGGVIEGWVRKFAAPKGSKLSESRMGDLIELETNSETGDLLENNEGEQTPTATHSRRSQPTSAESTQLDERFPMRGRTWNAYASKDR